MAGLDNNPFLDDMMDGDDMLLDAQYPPLWTGISNMSLAQQQQQQQQPGMMMTNNQMQHALQAGRPMMHPGMRPMPSAHLDVDMMNAAPTNGGQLFQAYASQFGMKPAMEANPATDPNSVEAYAAMMGVKLESPRSAGLKQPPPTAARVQHNANYFESLLKMQQAGPMAGHGVGSMTLPAGVGGGFHPNAGMAPMLDPHAMMPPQTAPTPATNFKQAEAKAPPPPIQFNAGLVGSQTLSPEMLSSMIQNNMSSDASYGSNTWNASDFDYEKDQLISKADKSRERNRDHSRKSRLRKKAFVETLKQEVKQLQIYKDLVDQNPDVIALVSMDQDRKIIYASASFARVLGYPELKLMKESTSFLTFVHPEHVARLKAELSKLAKFQDLTGVTFPIKHAKGMFYKAQLSARVGDQGVVLTTRIEKDTVEPAL